MIRADLDRRAAELGAAVKPDPGLLDEVTGLVEFPVVLAGSIDADFMAFAAEVLQTAMRTHQKYFSCIYPNDRPAPHFLFVANNLTEDGGKAIIAGNERVLRARLADARFFWDQDRKIRSGRPRRGAQGPRLPRQARQRLRQGRADGAARGFPRAAALPTRPLPSPPRKRGPRAAARACSPGFPLSRE